jgi:transcriptional regulator with XRE-family HTH domain
MNNRPINNEMHSYINRFAKHILLHRVWNDLTQSDIANTVGVTFQQVQKWEKAKNRITADQLYHLFDKMSWNIAALDREPEIVLEYFYNRDYVNRSRPEKYDFIKRKWLKVGTLKATTLTQTEERI